jgi:hypothetical protein
VEPDGTPNHPQGPSKLFDFDELRIGDGWMRATSPSGQAAYEGVVAWTPSARTGSLPAERGQSSADGAIPESDASHESDASVASAVDDAEVSLEEGATDG